MQKETTYLMETRDGLLVSVPESRLEAFEQAQRDRSPLTPREEQLAAKIKERLLGTKK